MSYGYAINEVIPSGGELEAGPSAVAVADGADFLVFGFEGFGTDQDLGFSDGFAVATDEAGDIY
jgi:hypothetical protein